MRQGLTRTGRRRDTIARKARATRTLSIPDGGKATWAVSGKAKPARNNSVSRQGGAGPMRVATINYVGHGDYSQRVRKSIDKYAINRVERHREVDRLMSQIEARLQSRKG